MVFWIFMLIQILMIPFIMIGFGWLFCNRVPADINGLFGYRTSMSMKNEETWRFAHLYCGKFWLYSGLISLPISFLGMLFVLGRTENGIGFAGVILISLQMIPLLASIFFTERALRRHFDRDGMRLDV